MRKRWVQNEKTLTVKCGVSVFSTVGITFNAPCMYQMSLSLFLFFSLLHNSFLLLTRLWRFTYFSLASILPSFVSREQPLCDDLNGLSLSLARSFSLFFSSSLPLSVWVVYCIWLKWTAASNGYKIQWIKQRREKKCLYALYLQEWTCTICSCGHQHASLVTCTLCILCLFALLCSFFCPFTCNVMYDSHANWWWSGRGEREDKKERERTERTKTERASWSVNRKRERKRNTFINCALVCFIRVNHVILCLLPMRLTLTKYKWNK